MIIVDTKYQTHTHTHTHTHTQTHTHPHAHAHTQTSSPFLLLRLIELVPGTAGELVVDSFEAVKPFP